MVLEGLEVSARSLGSTRVLSVTGHVDGATVDALAGAIREAVDGGPETIVVDLSAVTFFSCGGCGVLLTADEHARREGCRFVVVPGTEPVRQVLDHADCDQRLTIAT